MRGLAVSAAAAIWFTVRPSGSVTRNCLGGATVVVGGGAAELRSFSAAQPAQIAAATAAVSTTRAITRRR